ncbi:MAG TPA: LuxR C-terminal-related transcriptional regulator [Candidatus Dormibacteraeota bacterium]|nr:LuxR C-terminal-related transcriptional regulator [Candidatus Dormibacteraeota bacterium]
MAKQVRRLGNLPAEATSFIGRRRELAELRRKLGAARVVSLVGPGGVGKTRLALRAASDLARGFSGGAWLVELAEVRDPALVGNAVMAALDLRDQAATEPRALLRSYLADKELLLVLDNCEHLLEAAAEIVSEVVRAAPGVRVIATSREPLAVAGEHVLPIPPLELPAVGDTALRQNEAVVLFVERAAAAAGTFELTSANQAVVADVCRRLDGLPLAIELAAVRTRVLSVEQIRDRLSDRFGLLVGGGRAAIPRHQTLETTIEWSHDLLSDSERTLLRRLCVFAGRFTLEDVKGVCEFDLEQLSSLVEKSLVIKEDLKGVACYRLHETMREYSALKLRESGEVETLAERCTDYYVQLCALTGPPARYQLAPWLEWMELEIDNVRAILRHCLDRGDFSRGVDLAASLGWFWITRATTEGVGWLDRMLAGGRGERESVAWACFLRGFLAVLQADTTAALPWLVRAAEGARELDNAELLTQATSMASIAAMTVGDRAASDAFYEEALTAVGEANDLAATTSVLQARALNGMFTGDLDAVREATSEGVHLSRGAGDLYVLEIMLMELAFVTLVMGDAGAAKPLYTEALQIAQRIDDRLAQSYLLAAFAWFAAGDGQARLGAQLLGAAEATRLGAGAGIIAPLAPLLEQAEESAVAALGRAKFDAELTAGKRLNRETAIRLALGESGQIRAPSAVGETGAGVLGKRQADVARLVAEGLSNRQIGARLFISERTVDSHVRSILNKLGFNSRAQIAGWFAAGSTGGAHSI